MDPLRGGAVMKHVHVFGVVILYLLSGVNLLQGDIAMSFVYLTLANLERRVGP
jgi:hypothetical protein